jgi:hypothetical protein
MLASVIVLVSAVLGSGSCFSQNVDPKGLAILQRVIDVRNAEPNLSVEFDYEIAGQGKRSFKIHVLGDRLRSEEFEGGRKLSAFLILGDEVWAYHFSDYSDLQKTDLQNVRSLGFNAFSPRVFGITTFLTLGSRLEDLLFSDADKVRVLPRQPVIGVSASANLDVVEVDRGNVTLSNAVDPATGRIYKRVNFVNHKEDSTAVSTYETDNKPEWLPSTVRMFLGGRSESVTRIKCTSRSPDKSLFELRSLGIPVDTPVLDVAMRRRFGKWNGERIVDVHDGAVASIEPSTNARSLTKVTVIVLNVLVVAGLLAYLGFRRRLRR